MMSEIEPSEYPTIDVLDHGSVRLVDRMGDDLAVVSAARQSYGQPWRAGAAEGSDERLIRYLWRHKHSTPFEAVVFNFQVKAPIFVWRQWQRHRTWPFWSVNEQSGRYMQFSEEYYIPKPEIVGRQSLINKQGRAAADDLIAMRERDIDFYRASCARAFTDYRWLLGIGWPRELARCVLPLASYSVLSGRVDLWNLFNFLTLRCDERAQYEIRQYANAILDLIRPIVPVCVAAWEADHVAH